jgi:membrane protease YdiL (CAAX protease family)
MKGHDMKETHSAILFSLICFLLITVGLLFFHSNMVQVFILLVGLAAILIQKFVHREPIRGLGYRWAEAPWIVYGIVIPFVILLVIAGIGLISEWVKLSPRQEMSSAIIFKVEEFTIGALLLSIFIQFVMTFLANFISEELAFRGFLITRFRALPAWKAVLISSVIFGLWHIPVGLLVVHSGWLRLIIYAVNIACVGVVFGWLFVRSGSLIPACLAHGVWNALEYTFWGMGNMQGVFTGTHRILFDPEEGVAGTIVLLIAGVVLLVRLSNMRG